MPLFLSKIIPKSVNGQGQACFDNRLFKIDEKNWLLDESRKGNENTRAISVPFDLCTIFETQDKTVKKKTGLPFFFN